MSKISIPQAYPLPQPITVWRICSRRHAGAAFSGEGARRFGGRWNFPGTAMVYASDSLSLAALEILVQAGLQDLPDELVYVKAEVPARSLATHLGAEDLPANWRSYPADASLRECGSRWLRQSRSTLLIVPSAVIPQQDNLLLNQAHSEFASIRQEAPQGFGFEPRLLAKTS